MNSIRRATHGVLVALAVVVFLAAMFYRPGVDAACVGPERTPRGINLASTTVGTSWTTIGTTNATTVYLAGRFPAFVVEVANANDGNSGDLNDFRMQCRAYSGGSWHTKFSGSDWSNGNVQNRDSWLYTDANGAYVNTLGSGQSVILEISQGPYNAIRFQAKADANALVSIHGMAK